MDFNFDYNLVCEIKRNPVLFDPKHNNFKNNSVRSRSWDKIAEKMVKKYGYNISKAKCQEKWKYLQRIYKSEIRKYTVTESNFQEINSILYKKRRILGYLGFTHQLTFDDSDMIGDGELEDTHAAADSLTVNGAPRLKKIRLQTPSSYPNYIPVPSNSRDLQISNVQHYTNDESVVKLEMSNDSNSFPDDSIPPQSPEVEITQNGNDSIFPNDSTWNDPHPYKELSPMVNNRKSNDINNTVGCRSKKWSQNELFLLSIAGDLDKMSDKEQRRVRLEIQKLITGAEYTEE